MSDYPVYRDVPGEIWSKLSVMTHTFKDAKKKQRFLGVVRRGDGTYDLFLDDALDRSSIPEQWLQEELCVRFGFCGEEYESILRELTLNGRTRLSLSS